MCMAATKNGRGANEGATDWLVLLTTMRKVVVETMRDGGTAAAIAAALTLLILRETLEGPTRRVAGLIDCCEPRETRECE